MAADAVIYFEADANWLSVLFSYGRDPPVNRWVATSGAAPTKKALIERSPHMPSPASVADWQVESQ